MVVGTDGGSGSGSGDAGGTPPPASKNKTVQMSMDQAYAEIADYKRIVGDKATLMRLIGNKDAATVIIEMTQQLEEVNKVLEGQEKGRLIGEILPRSKFTVADLAGKTVDDLKNVRATLDQAMPPRVNSVRFGVHSADLSDREKGLTVGDLSVVTAARRKGVA